MALCFHYLKKEKSRLFGLIFFVVLYSLVQIYYATLIKVLLDVIEKKRIEQLLVVVGQATLYLCLFIVIRYAYRLFRGKMVCSMSLSLKNEMLSSLIYTPLSDYPIGNSAEIINVLFNDLQTLQSNYFDAFVMIIPNNVLPLFSICFAFFINWKMAIVILLSNVAIFYIPYKYQEILSRKASQLSETRENLLVFIKDILSGFEVVKCFHLEKVTLHNSERLSKMVAASDYEERKVDAKANSITMGFLFYIFMLVVIVGGYLIMEEQLSIGELLMLNQIANFIQNPLQEVIENLNKVKSCGEIVKKVEGFLNPHKSEKQVLTKIKKRTKDSIRSRQEKERQGEKALCNLCVNNLSFSYYGVDKLVINHLAMTFEAGKKYAIVGQSGCGKSTLIKLFMHYFKEYEGEIFLDDIEISQMDLYELYDNIAMVHQNVFLFEDTIENNIALYKEHTTEDMERAISIAGLTEFVAKQEKGIQTIIVENGKNISGGERQRMSIARALLHHTPILLLDEATSSLDNITAYDIEKRIASLSDRMVINMTHQLNSDILKLYDKIIVLKEGKIVEQGTFRELLDKYGYFYSLYHIN